MPDPAMKRLGPYCYLLRYDGVLYLLTGHVHNSVLCVNLGDVVNAKSDYITVGTELWSTCVHTYDARASFNTLVLELSELPDMDDLIHMAYEWGGELWNSRPRVFNNIDGYFQ